MEAAFTSKRVDRRTLLVGGASIAVGGMFLGTAGASSADAVWTGGIVAAARSGNSVDVNQMPLEVHRLLQVKLAPGTVVRTELSAGKTVMIEGAAADDGAPIVAQRVIRAVFGRRSEIER